MKNTVKKRVLKCGEIMKYCEAYDSYKDAHRHITCEDGYNGAKWVERNTRRSVSVATVWFRCTINPDSYYYSV